MWWMIVDYSELTTRKPKKAAYLYGGERPRIPKFKPKPKPWVQLNNRPAWLRGK